MASAEKPSARLVATCAIGAAVSMAAGVYFGGTGRLPLAMAGAGSQDIVLGIYYMTRERAFAKGKGKVFASPGEVRAAYEQGEIALQAKVTVRMDGQRVETTTGRVLLYDIVPKRIPFDAVNKVMDKKQLQNLIDLTYRLSGEKETVLLADRVRSLGYGHATKAGISICLENMVIPRKKQQLLEDATKEVDDIQNQYTEGLITVGERYNKVIDIWAQATEKVAQEMMTEISFEVAQGAGRDGKREERRQPSFNPIYIMPDSGARGSAERTGLPGRNEDFRAGIASNP